MQLEDTFLRLGVSLGVGLLVGLQRQRTEHAMAGFRTFPLIALLGTITASLAPALGGWAFAAGLVGVAGFAAFSNLSWARGSSEPADPGLTTEVAMLLTYAIGGWLAVGPLGPPVATSGVLVVLLQLKQPMHQWVRRLGETDFRAIVQFVLISLVILPILPDRDFGPFQVLNAREIWWMVVLIVGLGLVGYLSFKLAGDRAGTALSGLLGGLISSTATTFSYARQARRDPGRRRLAWVVIVIASSVVLIRILAEVAAVAPGHLSQVAPPLLALFGALLTMAAVAWASRRSAVPVELPEHDNPSELMSALLFALLYAGILLAVAAVKDYYGTAGLYGVAALSGLTDMDAITLSTSQLMRDGRLEPGVGWRVITIAAASNLAFKAGVAAVVGGWALGRRVALSFVPPIVLAILLVVWPF